jgi:hypothetical protein
LRWGERITVSYFNFDATLILTGLFCCSKLGDDEVDGVSSFACFAGGFSRCCCCCCCCVVAGFCCCWTTTDCWGRFRLRIDGSRQ